MTLKILNESNPVEIASFAVARGISDEPLFSWWVPLTLKNRDRIISAFNSIMRKKSHKFVIDVPIYI